MVLLCSRAVKMWRPRYSLSPAAVVRCCVSLSELIALEDFDEATVRGAPVDGKN